MVKQFNIDGCQTTVDRGGKECLSQRVQPPTLIEQGLDEITEILLRYPELDDPAEYAAKLRKYRAQKDDLEQRVVEDMRTAGTLI